MASGRPGIFETPEQLQDQAALSFVEREDSLAPICRPERGIGHPPPERQSCQIGLATASPGAIEVEQAAQFPTPGAWIGQQRQIGRIEIVVAQAGRVPIREQTSALDQEIEEARAVLAIRDPMRGTRGERVGVRPTITYRATGVDLAIRRERERVKCRDRPAERRPGIFLLRRGPAPPRIRPAETREPNRDRPTPGYRGGGAVVRQRLGDG